MRRRYLGWKVVKELGRIERRISANNCIHVRNSQRFTNNIVLKYSLSSLSETKHAYKLIILSVSIGIILKRA